MLEILLNKKERRRAQELLSGYANSSSGDPVEEALGVDAANPILTQYSELARYAGLSAEKRRLFVVLAAVIVALSIFLTLVTQRLAIFGLGAVALLMLRAIVMRLAQNRARAFERDYTALLVSLASSVKTGADPLQALILSGQLFSNDSEVRSAVQKFENQIGAGRTETSAIRSFAKDILHPDLNLFRNAFLLARKEGSSLAECLHRLAKVTRHRQSFRRKVKAAVAMQKLSAIGIGGCAVVIALIQFTSNPEAVREAIANPIGIKFLTMSGVLISGGIVWMLQLAKPKV